MDSFIHALWAAHYEDLLEEETVPAERSVLLTLLAEERAAQPQPHVRPDMTRPRWTGL